MSSWDLVNEKIEVSKIERFPYKEILGQSLTSFITYYRDKGLIWSDTFFIIKEYPDMKAYLCSLDSNRATKLIQNIRTSVHARYAEQSSLEARKNG